MEILYGKKFSKDLDVLRNDPDTRKRLLEIIQKIKEIKSFSDMKGVRKIQGYSNYFRIKLGDYRLGMKLDQNRIELIRFLHRREIYRRFP